MAGERGRADFGRKISNVLTQPRGGLLTLGAVFAIYFSSTGVEALRVALNRAYDLKDKRPWWLSRLESILYVFLGAAALLAVAILLVLGPLARAIAERYVPAPRPRSSAPLRAGALWRHHRPVGHCAVCGS